MSCTRRICKGAKTVARGGARLLPVIIIPRREHHPPGERAGPERKGWKQAMDGTNPFETDLERGPANHVPLSPLSFLPRAAAVYRSDEHTSELQSLMSTSYAVFCLKKTTTQTN